MTGSSSTAVPTRPKVALVIGSGALKCAAAFGAMKVLQREEVPIDMVVACSGGAFCATWVAGGGQDPLDDCVEQFLAGWRAAMGRVSFRALMQFTFPRLSQASRRVGLVDDRKLNDVLRNWVGERRFEDLPIPMHLVATDSRTGEQVVLSRGALLDGIRATISVPVMFPAWPLDGRELVDGAVCDPLPVDVAIREGAEVIIAMGFEETLERDLRSALGRVLHLQSLVVNHLFRAQYAFYNLSHHAEMVPIIPEFDHPVGMRDLHLVPHLVQRGEEAAERQMPYIRRLLQPEARHERAGPTRAASATHAG